MSKSSVMMKRRDKRHLPKMYTLVVTMNWNWFRNIFRNRFRIFYHRFELSHWVRSNLCEKNNKAFCNLFCNSQRNFHTSPTRIIEAVNHSSNSTIAFTRNLTSSRNVLLVNAIAEFEEWLTVSIIRVRRFRRGVKTLLWITEWITKSFVI